MNVRLRFKDPANPIRYVKGRDLAPHPANWRSHPAEQMDALRGLLAEVGMCDVLKGFETPDGRVMLIDGHARAEVLPDQDVPVLILDVNPSEAKTLLATFDPISALAEADAEQLDELLRDVEVSSPALARMLENLASTKGAIDTEDSEPAGVDEIPERYQILIEFADEASQSEWLAKLSAEGLHCRSLIS
jgi:hypothetical protein